MATSLEFLLGLLEQDDPVLVVQEDFDEAHRDAIRTWQGLGFVAAAPLAAQSAVEVQVTPAQLQLNVGQKDRLFLSAYDANGNLLVAPTFTFVVAQPSIAKVDPDGTVATLAPGSTGIEVRAGSGKATVTLTVTAVPSTSAEADARPAPAKPVPRAEPEPPVVLPPGARLEATPARLQLIPRETAQVVVALRSDQSSGIGRTHVTWKSLAPDVATVTDSGVVQGLSSGEAQLMATGPGGLTAAVELNFDQT